MQRIAVLALSVAALAVSAAPAAAAGFDDLVIEKQALAGQARASSPGAIASAVTRLAEPRRSGVAAIARRHSPGRIMVGAATPRHLAAILRALHRLGSRVRAYPELAAAGVSVRDPAALARALRRVPGVAFAEPVVRRRIAAGTDPLDQADPQTGIPFNWAFDAVRAGEALAAVGGGSDLPVAVIDTGVDAGHPDLAGQVTKQFNSITGRSDVTDEIGHGTFVSGTFGMVGGNGVGATGVAGKTPIFAVKASSDGSFDSEVQTRGVLWAVREGAQVINLSLAGPNVTEIEARSLVAAFFLDRLPVASAGNNARKGNPVEFPAALIGGSNGEIGPGLSVGAVTPDGSHAAFSNFNSRVSLAAPGGGIDGCHGVLSTVPRNRTLIFDAPHPCRRMFGTGPDGRWSFDQGTSFAAPIVSGLATLAWKANGELASEQVGHLLSRSAKRAAGAGWNPKTGWGIVDAAAAVALAGTYDTVAPKINFSVRRSGRVLRARVRARERTKPGDELAGRIEYGLSFSLDNKEFKDFVPDSRKPITTRGRLDRGDRVWLRGEACDRNLNCAFIKRGPFRG